jgi:hypothetical protein
LVYLALPRDLVLSFEVQKTKVVLPHAAFMPVFLITALVVRSVIVN